MPSNIYPVALLSYKVPFSHPPVELGLRAPLSLRESQGLKEQTGSGQKN